MFIKAFHIDADEALENLIKQKSIEDIFIRRLKPGARPISRPFCSPCDGTLSQSGPCRAGDLAVQIKGWGYSLSDLVGSKEHSFASFATIYLAPHNYHRVHSPIKGKLVSICHIPGELWPVNNFAVRAVPGLFCRNERLVFEIEAEAGRLFLVMVGALNVGRMTSPFWPNFCANSLAGIWSRPASQRISLAAPIDCGDELGVFMLGSTVVLALDTGLEKAHSIPKEALPRPVRLGQAW